MRTTLDLPEVLLKEAMTVTHCETKTAVIILALQDIVRKTKIQELRQYKGRIDLDINLDELRGRAG
jgi:hypothetical protein